MRTELQSFAINSNFAIPQQLQSARPELSFKVLQLTQILQFHNSCNQLDPVRLEVTVSKKSNQFGRDDDVMIERASYEYVVPRWMATD
jgi:hypothetical protein